MAFLQEVLPGLLEEVGERPQYFQHDGAPAHYFGRVRDHLNAEYPRRWFGRNGPFRWPPRSPDLTPLDFFLWGYMKDVVYKTVPEDQLDTLERIRLSQADITPEMLENVRTNIIKRCEMCLQRNGGTFEHLMR